MSDRVSKLESRLAAVEKRLNVLEGAEPTAQIGDQEAPVPSLGGGFVANASIQIGHVLLIFGGAYLLRAITDFQFVPTAIGISMGAAYALFWLLMAWRKGGVEQERASAAFYGATSVLLALPLLVEAVSRFKLLTGVQGTIALSFYCFPALAVAVGRDLRSLGWLAVSGSIATAFAVLVVAHNPITVSVFLLLLGLGSLWAVYRSKWMGPQWLGAAGINVSVLTLIVFSRSEQWSLDPVVPLLIGALSLVAYLLSFVYRSHLRGCDLGFFEALQTLVAAGIVFVAAVRASQAGQLGFTYIGALTLILGCCAYALAFTSETRSVRGRNYFYYTTVGLLFVVAGTAMLLPPAVAAALWSLMALTAAWFSGRTHRVTLSLQCTFLLLAAGVGSGILTAGLQALADNAATAWPILVPWHLGIALTTVACLFIPVAQRSDRWGALSNLPQLIVLALSVWEVGGLMVVVVAPILADAGSAEPNLAILAALRTAVLTAASVTLALSSRFHRWPEARWLVYPVLILVGLKLIVEDFPHGQPATLFVALAFVGGSLLLVAKLLKRDERTSQGL